MKKKRSISIAALLFAVVLSVVGTSCSAVSPTALTVNSWALTDSDFQSQLDAFAKVYETSGGASGLRSADGNSWATSYTAAFLSDQLSLRLAQVGVANRGLTVTDADRADAKTLLEQNFTAGSGTSVFADLPVSYQRTLIEGVAAQTVLGAAILAEAQTDEGLRNLYEATKGQYEGDLVCASHILILANPTGTSATATPTDAQYATALTSVKAVQTQLIGTSNFATIAAAKSQDTGSAQSGGALPCSPKGTYVTEFDNAAWAQPVGVVGEPVKTSFGYHLVLVTARGKLTFEQLKDSLKQSVLDNAEAIVNAELVRIAADANVSVNGRYGQYDKAVAKVVAPSGATATTIAGLPLQ
ncbi:MAG: peptidylprolyl isomerase [Acidimicrobiales bacterium]